MKVGIFGTGNVGRTIAEKFASEGNEVMIGTRDVEDTLAKTEPDAMGNPAYKAWQKNNLRVKLGSFEDTAKFGELIVISTSGNAAKKAIELGGKENFSGKIVIDMTNPVESSVPPKYYGEFGNSIGEQVQHLLPEAKVVKTFNQMGVQIVVNPQREDGDPVLFLAGNDTEAKLQVSEIAKKWGWKEVVDFGDISQSFWLETLVMLWIQYAFKNNSWSHAFSFLRK